MIQPRIRRLTTRAALLIQALLISACAAQAQPVVFAMEESATEDPQAGDSTAGPTASPEASRTAMPTATQMPTATPEPSATPLPSPTLAASATPPPAAPSATSPAPPTPTAAQQKAPQICGAVLLPLLLGLWVAWKKL